MVLRSNPNSPRRLMPSRAPHGKRADPSSPAQTARICRTVAFNFALLASPWVASAAQPTSATAATPATQPAADPTVDHLYRQAADARSGGDYVHAAQLYAELLHLLPPTPDPGRQRDRGHLLNDALSAYLEASTRAPATDKLTHLEAAAALISAFQDEALSPETRDLVTAVREQRDALTPDSKPDPIDPPPCPACDDPRPRVAAPPSPRTQKLERGASILKLTGAIALVPAVAGTGVAFFSARDQRQELEERREEGPGVEIDDMLKSNSVVRTSALVGFGAGLVAVASITAGLILDRKAKRSGADQVGIIIAPTPNSASVAIFGQF